jgi:hypothetical protein
MVRGVCRGSIGISRASASELWAEILPKYTIDPYQQFTYTTGKNASDITPVATPWIFYIAVDSTVSVLSLRTATSHGLRLAYGNRVPMSSASVSRRLPRVSGRRAARFLYTENLLPEAQVSTTEAGPSAKALQPPSAAIPIFNKASVLEMVQADGIT